MTKTDFDTQRGPRRGQVRRRGPHSAAFLVSAAVAGAVLFVLGWLSFVSVPRVQMTLRHAPGGTWVVADVPVAEMAWQSGVRPGMTVVGFAAPGSEPSPEWISPSASDGVVPPSSAQNPDWNTIAVTDGVVTIDIPRHPVSPDPWAFYLGAIALLFALAAYGVAPTAGWWLLEVPVLAGLAVASDLVPASIAFAFALAPPAVGAAFASVRPRRLHSIVPAAAWLAVVAVGAVWLAAYFMRADSWTATRQLSAAVAIGLLALGTLGVVDQAARRVRARRERDAAGHASPAVFAAAVMDELTPGRAESRLLATERERAALAADLHADILPELAAVIRSVDAGMEPAEAAWRLRSVSDDLRDLMTERRLVVLDELGLLPALEWLAERVRERTNVTVDIDVDGDPAARAPREVELAAYRIAQQAMDNALVHAQPSRIQVAVLVSRERLRLAVSDNGSGVPADAEGRALRAGRLGLADMRSRATTIGAALIIEQRAEGGTIVELRWPA